MSAGLTFPEKVTVTRRRRRGHVSRSAPFALNSPGDRHQRGGDDAEGTAEGDAAGAVELEGTDVARSVAGQPEAAAWIFTWELPRKSVGIAVGFPGVVDRRRGRGQLEVGVEEEVRRAVRAGPGVDREDEGRVADEVALVVPRPRRSFPAAPG